MAQEFKLLFVLCLVVASLVSEGAVEAGSSTAPPTTVGEVTNSQATAATTGNPGTTSNTTGAPAVNSTTPGGSSNATAAPTASPTNGATPQPPSDPCANFPCGRDSTCEPRANFTFVCLCLAGSFYNNESKSCENAKAFPGQLQFNDEPYKPTMANKTSEDFLKAAKDISNALKDSFKRPDFSGSTVLEIREIPKSRVWSRAENGIIATVDIFFKASSKITTEEFEKEMKTATSCTDCPLKGATFSVSDLCKSNPCDTETTSCNSKDGTFSCNCRDAYIKTDFSDRICIACPSGKKASENQKECESCPFGYSGLNCKESWQLTLVIVGSVLGGLLLITLILLPVLALKPSKKSSKKSKYADAGEPYVSPLPAKVQLAGQAAPVNMSTNAFASAGMPRIPRAASNWDRTNLEMTPSNSRQNLVPAGGNSRLYEDTDDMAPYNQSRPQSSLYAQSRPQSSLYGQTRPQNNPYAQSRPQANPYASSQGQSNPYYN